MSDSAQNGPIAAAGVLLTGGASRRMGRPKAAIPCVRHGDGRALAHRTAAILASATDPVIEVGPGYTGLPNVVEDPPGSGPLMAVSAAATWLMRSGWTGPAVVVATDLALLETRLVDWLVAHPGSRSVVPLVGGRPQPLCARYDRGALDAAARIASAGSRAMKDLLGVIDHVLVGPDDWGAAGIHEEWFADLDTPGDLASYRQVR